MSYIFAEPHGPAIYIVQRYMYDNAWRTTDIYHTIDGNTEQRLVTYEYNLLGQLVTKRLHYTGSDYLQNVDLRYNIRGWLTSINNATLTADAGVTNTDLNDYFGLELFYNRHEKTSLGNSVQYNGNLSAAKWKGAGVASGNADQRSYSYNYDYSDRLLAGTFKANTGSAWTKEKNTINESMAYDVNGNITKLVRKKNYRNFNGTALTSAAMQIDSLTYSYTTGNQLSKVDDGATTEGFKDGVSSSSEYVYDGTGSMTSDKNKGIDSIRYNVLGKPVRIKFSTGDHIDYVYDGQGSKQKMTSVAGAVTTTTDYVGAFIYINSTLSSFSSPEGRVVKNGAAYEYQYSITDHQGNTRVVFSSVTPTPIAATAGYENPSTEAGSFNSYGGFQSSFKAHSGTYSSLLTGSAGNQIAAAKMFHVYGGDKVELSGYAYSIGHNGSGASNLSNFATVLLGAFQLTAPAPGETHTASAAISAEGVSAAAGYGEGSTDNTDVRAFFTILVFDKNFNLIDTKYQQVTNDSNWDLIDLTYTAQEECQVYAYISMEDGSLSDLYIDDVTITHTPSKVIQYNEYYPFGMQTDRSWTRGTATANNFLSNGGTELNPASQLYDLGFRNLDPVLGRFHQVDPMADKYGSQNPYHYASNNPANLNDVSGLDPEGAFAGRWLFNNFHTAMADGGGGGGGGDGLMNSNPDGIQSIMNSYYDNTPASQNVFNWFQPTTEQLVNDAFNRTPAGTNAYYVRNGDYFQKVNSGSTGPVIYNQYVSAYVSAYLITMNGGVNTNKELYERALKAIADWGAAPDQENIYEEINDRYDDAFLQTFMIPFSNIIFENNAIGKIYMQRFMSIAKYSVLSDEKESLPDLMVVGYEIVSEQYLHGNTVSSVIDATEIIPRSTWTNPIFQNPGQMYSSGIADPFVVPTQNGSVGLRVYFQFVPNQ